MKAFYVFTVVALRLWSLGAFFMVCFAISDMVFKPSHNLLIAVRRIGFGFIWPLALFSARGRLALLGKLKGI